MAVARSRSQISLRRRFVVAFEQSLKGQSKAQIAADWLSGVWAKALGLLFALVGIYGLNDRHAADIFAIFEKFLPWFIAAFLVPYGVIFLVFMTTFASRFKATYVGERSDISAGISIEDSVRDFVSNHAYENYAISGSVEVVCHPFLDKRISSNGWAPEDVKIEVSKAGFVIPDRLRSNAKVSGENNQKFALIGASRPTTDDFRSLNLKVAETTYQDIERARSFTDGNERLRHEFSRLAPEEHRIPNSLCLHGVVRLADGACLGMKRRAQTSYFPNAVSVSFEEQLCRKDFQTPGISASESLFRRAICEEVFPLSNRYEINPDDTWERVRHLIDHYRYWSLVFEEKIGNFALFGVCQMKLTLREYLAEYSKIQQEYRGLRDDEGKLYFLDESMLKAYLHTGHGSIKSVNFIDPTQDQVEPIVTVHPTMPYRCATLLNCLDVAG